MVRDIVGRERAIVGRRGIVWGASRYRQLTLFRSVFFY